MSDLLNVIMLKKHPMMRLSDKGRTLVNKLNEDIAAGIISLQSYPCISCGSDKRKEIFTTDAFGINQSTIMCLNCGMVYGDPRMTPESQDKFYDSDTYRLLYDSYSGDVDFVEAANRKIALASSLDNGLLFDTSSCDVFGFYSFLKENIDIADIDSVCEIGAGSGANLIPFMKAGKKAYGVEPSSGLSSNAEKHGIDLSYSSIEEFDKKVDLFLLIHALEHLHDPIEYLQRIARFSPKYILIEVPGIVSRFPPLQNAHNFYFSKNTLLKVCSYASLRCIGIQHFKLNNFVLGLFIIDSSMTFEYNHQQETRKIKAIVRFQKIKHIFPPRLKGSIKKVLSRVQ